MTTYRVDIDGETVWTEERDQYDGLSVFPPEYLSRPAEPEGELRPTHDLFIDDVLIGVQRSHTHEAEVLEAEAVKHPQDSSDAAYLIADAHTARRFAEQARNTHTPEEG